MFSKLFTGLIIVVIACCLYGYTTLQESDLNEQGISKTKAPAIISEENPDLAHLEPSEKNKAKFLQFIYQLSQVSSISSNDTNLWQEAQEYFPQMEQFKNHNLSLQYISSKETAHLIFYEFRQAEATNNDAMYLANFSDQGKLVDQLALKAISFDGTLSLNVVGTDIIEVEYIDFLVKNHFRHSNNYIQKQDENSKLGYQPIPEREVVLKKQYIERTEIEYYKTGSDQHFQKLSRNNTELENRSYPQAASRIISKEELQLMKQGELELMRNEIYASYGLTFTDNTWSDYFSEMDWYTPLYNNVDELLTDVECINIEHSLSLSKKDYSFSKRR